MIIPRVRQSEKYIKAELDEMEREDNFRLKRFKELKLRRAGGKILCALCKTELEQVEICELCQSCQEPRRKKILVCPLCEKHAEDEELNKEICRKNVCKNVSSSQSRGDRIKFEDVCGCSDPVGDVLKLLCPNCQKKSEQKKQTPVQEQCSCEKIQKVSSVKKMDSKASVCSCEKGKSDQKEMNMEDLCKIIGKKKISKLKEIYLQKQQSEDEIVSKLKEVFDNDTCKCSDNKNSQKENTTKGSNNMDLCPICKKDLTEDNLSEQQCLCAQSFSCAPKENSNEALCSKCKKDKGGSKKISISDPGLGAGKNRHTCNLCLKTDFRSFNRNSFNSKSDTLCSKCKNDRGNPKNVTIQFTSCLSKNNAFNNTSKDTQKKDDLLKICSHIDDIINLTSEYKTSNSVEEFIEACKDAKCKINKIPEKNEAPVSNKMPEDDTTAAGKKCVCKSSLSKSVEEKTIDPKEDAEQELGIFVTKFQEVVTVKRYKNSDGTIKETRQVITIRTETKDPNSSELSDSTEKNNKPSCLSSPGNSVKQKHSACSSQSGKALKVALPNANVRERSSQTSSLSYDISIDSCPSCTLSSDDEESGISIEQIDNCSAGAQTEDRNDICDKCKRMADMKRNPTERSFSETDAHDRTPNECCAPQRKGVSKSCCAIKVIPKAQDNLFNNKEKGENCLELLKKILLEADQSTASCFAKQNDDVSYDSKLSNNTMDSKKRCSCKPEPSKPPSPISCPSCPSLSGGSQQKCCHTKKSPNQIKFCKRESECPECSKKDEEKPQPKCICKSSEETTKSSMKNACSCVSLEQKNSKAKSSTCPSCGSKAGPKNTKSGSSCASGMTTKSSCSCMQDKEDTKACCMKSKQKCCPKESVPSCPLCGPKKQPEPPCPCSKKDKPIPKQSCTSCSSKATKSSSVCPCGEDSKETDNDVCCASNKSQEQCNEPRNCTNCDYKPKRKSSGGCGPKSKGNTIVYMSCFVRDSTPNRNLYKRTHSCHTQTNNGRIPEQKSSPCSTPYNHDKMDTPCPICKQQMEAVKTSCPLCKLQDTIDTPCPICKQKAHTSKKVNKCSICGEAMDAKSSSCNCKNKANNCSLNPDDASEECCSSSVTSKSCCKKIRIECPDKDIVSCPSCVALQKPPCTCKSKKISIEHKSCSSCGSLITTKSESCICTEKDNPILKDDSETDDPCCKPENDISIGNSSSCSLCSQLGLGETPFSILRRTSGYESDSKRCSQCGAPIIPESACPCGKKPSQPETPCCPSQPNKKPEVKGSKSQKSLKDCKVDCECHPKAGKSSKKSSKEYVYTPIIPCKTDSETKLAPDTSKCPLCNSDLQPEKTFVGNSEPHTCPRRQFSPTSQLGTSEFKCCSRETSPSCPSCSVSIQHKDSPCSCNSPSRKPVKNSSSNSYASAISPISSTCSCKEMGQQTQKSCYELDTNDQLCYAAPAVSYYQNPDNQCCSTETSSSCLKCSSNAQDNKSSCSCKSKKPEQSKSKPCASCGNPITPKPSKKCCDESDKQQCCTPSKSECTPKENSCSCAAKSDKKPQPARKASESQSCCDKPKSKCCSKDPPKEEEPCSCKSGAKKPEPMKTCASCGGPITPKPSCKCSGKKAPAKSSSLNKPPSKTSNRSAQSTQSCPVCTTPKEKKCDCKKEAKTEEKKCTCKKEPKAEEKKCTCKKEPKAEEKKCTCKPEPKPEPKCTCKKEPEPKEKKCTCKKTPEPKPAENKCNCKKGGSQSSTPARSVSLNITPQRAPSNTSKGTQASCPVCSTSKKETKKPETKCSCKKEPPAPEKKCTCKKEAKPAEKKCTCKKEPEPPAKKCTCKKETPKPPQKKCTCKEPAPPPAQDACPCKDDAKPSKYQVVTKSSSVPVKLSSSTSLKAKPSQKKCNCKEPEPPPTDACPCKADSKSNKYTVVTKSSSVPVKLSSSTSLKSKPSQKKCNCKEPEPPPTDACPCKADAKPSKYQVVTKSTSVPVKLSSSASLQKSPMRSNSGKSDGGDPICPTCGSSMRGNSACPSVKDIKKVSDKRSSSIRIQASESSCPPCPKAKDASTSTRRTERYDVRNLEMMKAPEPPKKKKACTCFSDSYVGVDNFGNTAAARASSYHGRCYH